MPTVNDAFADITKRIEQALATMTSIEQLTLIHRLANEMNQREAILIKSTDG
jgi:hypothetical protein